MVDCYAIAQLIVYIIAYKCTNESLKLNMKGFCTLNCVLKENSKIALRDIKQILHNFAKKRGLFKALYLKC